MVRCGATPVPSQRPHVSRVSGDALPVPPQASQSTRRGSVSVRLHLRVTVATIWRARRRDDAKITRLGSAPFGPNRRGRANRQRRRGLGDAARGQGARFIDAFWTGAADSRRRRDAKKKNETRRSAPGQQLLELDDDGRPRRGDGLHAGAVIAELERAVAEPRVETERRLGRRGRPALRLARPPRLGGDVVLFGRPSFVIIAPTYLVGQNFVRERELDEGGGRGRPFLVARVRRQLVRVLLLRERAVPARLSEFGRVDAAAASPRLVSLS